MPIEEFYARSESDAVTFAKTQIHFSASLVTKKNLLDYEYVRIGVDTELRKIYFAFQKEASPGLLKFYKQTERSKRKMVAAGKLYAKYDWIGAIREKEPAKKHFILDDVDQNDSEHYPKYKYFITIGYAWSSDKDFQEPDQFPEEPGVYRLKKNNEIVRIGEGKNIATRLKEHLKEFGDQVDTFDFEIIPDDKERKAEQSHLLESFKVNVGKLPKLNPISN